MHIIIVNTFSQVIEGYDAIPPGDFKKIDQDLSEGAGGNYFYLCYSRTKEHPPITMIEVIQGQHSDIWPAESPQMVRINVNCNPKGKYMYICYRPKTYPVEIHSYTVN